VRNNISVMAVVHILILMISAINVSAQDLSPKVELIEPPTRYFPNVERYRWSSMDIKNPGFLSDTTRSCYPGTYMKCIEAANPSELAKNHKRGLGGPQTFMPILAKYVQTGEKI